MPVIASNAHKPQITCESGVSPDAFEHSLSSDRMLDIVIDYNTFGGRNGVIELCLSLGLLKKTCPRCGMTGDLEEVKGSSIPRLRCSCGYRQSCRTESFFGKHQIGDIPLFLFVVKCYILRMTTKAIVGLTGSRAETITNYLNAIRETVCHVLEQRVRGQEFMFGGPDKAVEVDEAVVCKRKYNTGRKESKENIWVVGTTEGPLPRREVNDPELLRALQSREDERKLMAARRISKRKTAKKRTMQAVQETPVIPLRQNRRQLKLALRAIHGTALESAICQIDRRVDDPVMIDDDQIGSAFETSDRDFNGEIDSLFSQSRKGQAKKTLFFVVEARDRTHCTRSSRSMSEKGRQFSPMNGLDIRVLTSSGTPTRRYVTNGVSRCSSVTTIK